MSVQDLGASSIFRRPSNPSYSWELPTLRIGLRETVQTVI
ncbi:hypothetical protein NEIMUCOT_05852 [Neisseria mucosa ATCC 25996]|uniref:Uncharacterized protein n=1 Tax=Neisseria mucosa (strain ATCC 25996 / DSM 4631 / NCTC 10774 / M26) TaxID=546266 RepID=D2ZYY6_NEIM2|nr:hypothetical protein NEIMUCOT_05852 [Neisseria mucosa ATCC 25996]